ncbi:hypothetical protein RN001_001934 [Aquatica leii]|uniref:C2H2-type domain-containing protein n=1 Tax=Aquatica leii TaxID=1421715 RepID=A0AAN7QN61_9COLE|nr:hypothetical protein RN001_001934 [Aquatica leii]
MQQNARSNRNPNSSLSKFKKQIDSILKQLNTFKKDDKQAAFNYVREHFSESSLSFSIRKRTIGSKANHKYITPQTKKKKVQSYLKCKICEVVKTTKVQFLKHIEEHIEIPVTCRKCRKTFNSRYSFDWHLIHLCKNVQKTMSKKYKCLQCPKEFMLQTHLFLHQLSHKRNTCSQCGEVFTERINLIRHLLEIHNTKLKNLPFRCDQCLKSFVKQRSLFYHLQRHYKFVCMDCGTCSNTSHEHNNHVLTHKNQKPWQCIKCGDMFSRRQLYFNHLKQHDRYKCLTCKESFASQTHALKHRKNDHLVQGLEPRLHCPYCPSTFFRSLLLQMHLHKHRDEGTPLHCKFCNKFFQTPRQYLKHCLTTIHDKKSPENDFFVCEYCGKQFMKKHIFEKHLHRFHGEQLGPYTCTYCNYKTKFRPNLSRHLKLHFTKENQFICDHCGKYFSNEAVLRDHINYIHKEVKQFKCAKCDKCFKRKSELTRHLSAHSDLRPYCCEICSNTYKRISHLRRHEENAHGMCKQTNKVKRFVTTENGKVVPVSDNVKKGKQISNHTISTKNISSTTDKLYFQVLNKIPVACNSSETSLIEKKYVTSIPIDKDEVRYTVLPSLNFGTKVFSIIVKPS